MVNRFYNLTFLFLVLIGGFIYRDRLVNIWSQSLNHFFPCKFTISYSIGGFDTDFGISKKDFLSAVVDAEAIWEKPLGKNLFQYSENGHLKINLIYDDRQNVTDKLKDMGISVKNDRKTYDEMKAKYESIVSEYNSQKSSYTQRLTLFQERKTVYERQVNLFNKRGAVNKEVYNSLNLERDYLNREAVALNEIQKSLNDKVNDINTLTSALNQLVKSLNINVEKYNTIGGSLGREFEEGVYRSSSDGQEIDIFQFDSRTKLVRVLAHEFGHALGLDHNEDSKAIMYRLNNGINEKLTQTDLKDLKALCNIE